ncbi:enoyl-CoA hydratase/isomerase family protein [Sphingomonas parva]|uniref:Enoyl-CoA hydratase/isomerase family protein n=1 Tax=Sphingomonas parva TaxID=2555898 RepID=A0A4Y8ZTC7_9SPHN|nr:enoyl-CoA hydratase-related protein [Sphingomonas parva]TFI59271.1 enoyl-CoA hydratase/isomerase family protein [Sphingomonas parva]
MFDLALAGSVARLTLVRPEARNAIPAHGWGDLAARAEEAVAAGARLLLVGGAGAAFCAGADLGDFDALRDDPDARARFRTNMEDALERLARVPIPTLALIHGACFGAGVALAMACDLRLAAPAARFGITPAKLGIAYPQSDVARLVALVGPGQASRLLFTAGTIDAGEAARIGLVEIVSDDLESSAEALTQVVLANSAGSLAALKRGIGLASAGHARDAGQDESFEALFGGEDLAARLAAFRGR